MFLRVIWYVNIGWDKGSVSRRQAIKWISDALVKQSKYALLGLNGLTSIGVHMNVNQ